MTVNRALQVPETCYFGEAQHLYAMTIHAFAVASNHAHLLLSAAHVEQLARFMQFAKANVAKEVARLHDWPDRVWSRRYRAIPVVDDEAAHARIRYHPGLVRIPSMNSHPRAQARTISCKTGMAAS